MRQWWRSRSLRLRLALWHTCALVAVLAVYAGSIYVVVRTNLSTALNDRLRGDFQWAAEMSEQQSDGTLSWFEGDTGDGVNDSPWLQVWGADDGALIYRSPLARRLPMPESTTLVEQPATTLRTLPTPVGRFRLLSAPSRIGERRVTIQVARSEEPGWGELRDVLVILALALPLGVAVAGVGGYLLARRALEPVERMADRARVITAERLGDRLPVDNPSNELGKLATVFNDTLGRLEASFDRMRQFTADVSHELRTPLTAIRSVGEVGLRTARDEATCRRVIGSMLEDVDRMTSLVERLLAWSRADTGQARLQIEVFDLGELADEVVGQVGVLAEEKRQSLGVEVAGDVRCAADRQVLRQALLNLIDNAIKYTPAGGAIRVRVTGAGGHVRLDVSDSGPGIAGDQKTRVFDRYFRSTQGSAQKGSGLGLAITKWAVEANGGDLAVASSEGNGSTFSITLPGPRAVVTTATERASA